MSTPDLVPLATLVQVERTPSCEDGIPPELEEDLRAFGCKLIHQAGVLLKQCVSGPPPRPPITRRSSQKAGGRRDRSDPVPAFLVYVLDEAV